MYLSAEMIFPQNINVVQSLQTFQNTFAAWGGENQLKLRRVGVGIKLASKLLHEPGGVKGKSTQCGL